ncbi:MAG: FeoB-associated Cys-rich membrane protein [Clostridia bacterium]|nr:FeoB-associated Cys-rich membrane protein [Clostridia bacterium]MBR3838177.1 FeoB-associated Cys-rich membrane protein [Clostridia bacterium]
MLKWIENNIASIIVLLVVAAVISLIVVKIISDKRRGKSSCSCGCGGCALKDSCHAKEKEYISVNID